jgi:hypothetical protein
MPKALKGMTKAELVCKAIAEGVKGYSGKTKAQLIELLSAPKYEAYVKPKRKYVKKNKDYAEFVERKPRGRPRKIKM